MSSRESGQDGQRGKEIFQRDVAEAVALVMKMKYGESGQGGEQDLKMFEIAMASVTDHYYRTWSQEDGILSRILFEYAVSKALEIIKAMKEAREIIKTENKLFSPFSVYAPSSYDSPSKCCYISLGNRMYKLRLGDQGETLRECTKVHIPAEDYGLKVQVYTEEYIDALRLFDVLKRARHHLKNIRVGGRPYTNTIRSPPHGRSIIEPRAPPIQVVDRARGYGGSQTVFFDKSGGPCVIIPINPLQHGDQGFLTTTRNGEDGPGKVAQNALMSAFGGIVPMCFSTLDDALKDNCPGYIRAATYAGLVVITGITFVGLLSKKRAKAALRVVASAAIAAVSTTIVYKVPEDVYIKATCGVLGALATFVTMAIGW